MPAHVAIIMDGNGRWAKQRGWMRTRGHHRGAEVVRMVTTESVQLGIKHLTLYCFSSENWCRPEIEINYLMSLLDDFLRQELATLQDNGVRLQSIGQIHRLPKETQATLQKTVAATAGNTNMTLHLALSYGGRDEILDACRAIAEKVRNHEMNPDDVDEQCIEDHLYTAGSPDVDLLIRTAGEQRISNFLPWQSVYAEFVSVDTYWPEFEKEHYHNALREFQSRERRFGSA
jgi:undecaprenyl diphosphate synthase